MKKLIALLLVLALAATFVACGTQPATPTTEATEATEGTEATEDTAVMTYAEFMAAETDAKVCIETNIQANQSWWDGKVTLYLQDAEGAYFAYEVACSEEDSAKLVPGAKVRITGDKAIWSGEVEIMNGTIEFLEGDTFTAEAKDVTALLGTDELEAEMNKLVTVKGLTFKELSYQDETPGKDIYVTFTMGDAEYSFCVEQYLTGPDTDLYKAVEALQAGDVVDVTGFLYWYEGPNTHITAIEKAA